MLPNHWIDGHRPSQEATTGRRAGWTSPVKLVRWPLRCVRKRC